MNKVLMICLLVFTQVSITNAQSAKAKNSTKKHEMKYYKKKMVPKGEDYLKKAPITISQSITIKAPIADIWKVIDHTPGFVNWFPGVKWAKMENEAEKGLGAKRLAQLNSNKYYEEIIAYEKEKKWGFTMLESNSGMLKSIIEVIYLEKIDANSTKVLIKGGYEPQGMAKLIKGMIRNTIEKTWTKSLNGLKKQIEESSYKTEAN